MKEEYITFKNQKKPIKHYASFLLQKGANGTTYPILWKDILTSTALLDP